MATSHEGHRIEYSSWDDGWDAHYCADCNVWLSPPCCDQEDKCSYCTDRPATPLPVVANQKIVQEFKESKAYLEAVIRGEIDATEV